MSLYDDIGGGGSPGGGGGDGGRGGHRKADLANEWSANYKLVNTHRQAKKASLQQPKRKPMNASLAPVVDLKRAAGYGGSGSNMDSHRTGRDSPENELRFNHLTGRMEPTLPVATAFSSPFVGGSANTPFSGIISEYDPSYPNEYEEFAKRVRDQRRKEKDEEREQEEEEQLDRRQAERKGLYSDSDEGGSDTEDGRRGGRDRQDDTRGRGGRSSSSGGRQGGAAIAPPPMLLEEAPVPESKLMGNKFGMGSTVASKIMARMGYRQGQGLGKEGQGMSQALQVEKVSRRGGKIIHEKDMGGNKPPMATLTDPSMLPPIDADEDFGPVKAVPPASTADLLKNPSKVVLLLNMVGPGEVDEDLQPETAEECQKYGKVVRCVIHEMPLVPEIEAVRIFVEFESIPSAIKAVIDLNGRFFGGRVVRAVFYSQESLRERRLTEPA